MIVRNVTIVNFGVYGGRHEFNLQPHSGANFDKPVIIFRGKNGVGKTTLVEALRVGLHGPLALGNKVGQREFDDYLAQAIHHSGNGHQPTEASIELEFEYVHAGQQHEYQVQREWELRGDRLDHTLSIWEDGEELDLDENETKEQFLRELVPPGVLDLFFFDGEKIETLSSDGHDSHILLAETVKTLLGLDMVEQLTKDLDIFLARRKAADDDTNELREELGQLNEEQEELDEQYFQTRQEQRDNEILLAQLKRQTIEQQQRIASEGGQYAAMREERLAQKSRLEERVEGARRQVQELCGGLMPFAISPAILEAVSKRLQHEKSVQEARIIHGAVAERLQSLKAAMNAPDFWQETGLTSESVNQAALFNTIADQLIERPAGDSPGPETLILHFSEHERELLLSWIEQARNKIPAQFSRAVEELTDLEEVLARVEADLEMVPADETLRPLVEALNKLHRQMAELQYRQEKLAEEEQRLTFHRERVESRKEKVREAIRENRADDRRIQLAIKTQQALTSYNTLLTTRKVHQLEQLLTRRFNQMCRKERFLDRVEIDRATFAVTPYRQGRRYSREKLSAGEQQLFAIATLWALREVSGRPMPIVIDTPLSRLDTEHRLKMVQEFIPHSSHQVIVLGTDSELDAAMLDRLLPTIAHVYEMEFDTAVGATRVSHNVPVVAKKHELIQVPLQGITGS